MTAFDFTLPEHFSLDPCDHEHVGNELLFELVALCRGCHDRCHGVGQ